MLYIVCSYFSIRNYECRNKEETAIMKELTPFEKQLLDSQDVFEIRGKVMRLIG